MRQAAAGWQRAAATVAIMLAVIGAPTARAHDEPPRTVAERTEQLRQQTRLATARVREQRLFETRAGAAETPLLTDRFDEQGRHLEQIVHDPARAQRSRSRYDAAGDWTVEETWRGDALVERTTFTYDAAHLVRLAVSEDLVAGTAERLTWEYRTQDPAIIARKTSADTLVYMISYAYETDGDNARLLSATQTGSRGQPLLSTRQTWVDGRRRTKDVFGPDGGLTYGFTYEYDARGDLDVVTRRDADGAVVFRQVHARDADGLPVSVTDHDGKGTVTRTVRYEYVRFAATPAAFADAIVRGDGAAARAMGAAPLAAALTDAVIAQVTMAITAQGGPVTGLAPAWLEDATGGPRQYRVALRHGARAQAGPFDLQVVLDGDSRVAGVWLKAHKEAPGSAAATSLPPGARELSIRIEAPDGPLPGTLTLPQGSGPFAAVVLVHGSGPQDRDETAYGNTPFRDLAHGLAARGIASLRYDKRTLAAPATFLAHGAAAIVRHETIDDAVAAVALLRTRPEVDRARVHVLGHSLGGMVAPRIAREATADGLIIVAGAARPLPEIVVEQTEYLAGVDGTVSMDEAMAIARMKDAVTRFRAAPGDFAQGIPYVLPGVAPAYLADLEAHDGPALAAALDIPVFVLQGSRDYQVTMADFARWDTALRERPRACLRVYDGVDHLLRAGSGPSSPDDYASPRPVAPVVIEDIAAFIDKGCAAR